MLQAVKGLPRSSDGGVMRHIKKVMTVLAPLLGDVHRLIGMSDQVLGPCVVKGVNRHANACGNLKPRIPNPDWFRSHFQHAFKDRKTLGNIVQINQNHHKFIPANSGDRVSITQSRTQPFGHCRQELIAYIMAVQVVNSLETVQIKKSDGQHALMPLATGQGLFNAVGQQASVGHFGQDVVMRHVFKLVLNALLCCDVMQSAYMPKADLDDRKLHPDHAARGMDKTDGGFASLRFGTGVS